MQMDVEDFIDSVRRHPALWDVRNKSYHNRDAVRQGWNQVGEECQTESEAAKAKWKNLRDTFRSELKKMHVPRSGAEGTSPSGSKWLWFEHMAFLKDVITLRRMKNNHGREGEEGNEFQSFPIISDYSENNANLPSPVAFQEQEAPSLDNADSVPSNVQRFRKRKLSVNTDLLRIKKEKPKLIEKEMPQSETQDDSYHFFMSLLPTMRGLPQQSQLRARIKIQEILLSELEKSTGGQERNS